MDPRGSIFLLLVKFFFSQSLPAFSNCRNRRVKQLSCLFLGSTLFDIGQVRFVRLVLCYNWWICFVVPSWKTALWAVDFLWNVFKRDG